MINKKMVVSGAEYFSDDYKINPYYSESKIDKTEACKEHAEIVGLFKEAGIDIIKVPAPATSQDGVYAANWAIVKDGVAVMARLPEARKNEEAYAEGVLQKLGIKTIKVPNNMLFSGQGDALRVGKYLIAGRGYRSEPAAQQFVADTLGLELIQVHAIPELNDDGSEHINPATNHADSFFYDLDLAVSVLREDMIAYCKDALDKESQEKIAALPIEKIEVSLDEAMKGFACNLVSTGETVIMSDKAPKFKAELIRRGFKVLSPHVEELVKGGGFIRCVSLSIGD